MHRFEAAYVKSVKSFFGFERRYSVTQMFCDLSLPSFNTVIHNAQVRFDSITCLSSMYFTFGNLFSVLYVVCSYVCLSVFLYSPFFY